MDDLSDADWEKLTRDLSTRVAAVAPDWTDWEAHDPGITLVELFAFLTESLLYRADPSPATRTPRCGTSWPASSARPTPDARTAR